jgi:hypothetical protein
MKGGSRESAGRIAATMPRKFRPRELNATATPSVPPSHLQTPSYLRRHGGPSVLCMLTMELAAFRKNQLDVKIVVSKPSAARAR